MEVAATEQQRSKRQRGAGFPKGVSGNPLGKALVRARADELFGIMSADFGELSAVDEVLLKQACLLLARSERVHRVRDIDVGVRMSGEARRLLQSLQRKRDKRRGSEQPSLSEYLRETYGAPASDGAPLAAQNRDQAAEEPSADRRTSEPPSGSTEAAT
jgi:hypothetical protein